MNLKSLAAISLMTASAISYAAGPEIITPVPVAVTMGKQVNVTPNVVVKTGEKAFARLTASLPEFAREEAYRLTVAPKRIVIEANTLAGERNARASLAQMMRDGGDIPCCTVYDYPRFAYRGIMLDISRHFRDKDFILKQIDAMAMLRMNRLHLHLTDDAGWRIETESRPRLNSLSAWRPYEDYFDWSHNGGRYVEQESELAYGGYLSKADAAEIVSYAAERGITVVPEIEFPGHSREVVAAYPEIGCIGEDWAPVLSSEVCIGSEETFKLFEDVLREVVEVFPSAYIHIGGDEASRRRWKVCPRCRARMEQEGLKEFDELQSYGIARIEKIVNSLGRNIIGWDEILEGGLAPNATVMSWRGTDGGVKAAGMKHDVIMTPGKYCYLDHYQDAPFKVAEAISGYLPIDSVYCYDPLKDFPESDKSYVLGVQGNLWHEYIRTPERTEEMLYPRMYALAEVGWSQPSRKDAADFRKRALDLNEYLKSLGYNVFDLSNEYGQRKAFGTKTSHLALGKNVAYACNYSPSYKAQGETTLTDGLSGGWDYGDGRWQGFLCDFDATVDLGSVMPIHYAGASFFFQMGSDIFFPEFLEVWTSVDGENFTLADNLPCEISRTTRQRMAIPFGLPINIEARYIRFFAPRVDNKGFIFVDELVVN
ncbi:MAG: beta-N-acetylhexosaminidase [Bacteroidales bacterium]|nr:beta-N-acetylhexosaminidase [Bacteroidales bacterium]